MAAALHTPRLILREWREEDAEPFALMSADPEVMRYLLPFADRAAMDGWIATARAHWSAHGFGRWVVEPYGEAGFVGVVGLSHVHRPHPAAPAVEVAWRLARPYWGKGFATEAARAAIDDGFARLHLREIVAFTVPANRASQRVMQRLGMTRDPADDFDHPRVPPGHELRRHVLYRLRR